MRARLPFMTRLPKKRGITQVEEDKSLILRWFYLAGAGSTTRLIVDN
jgi:hypothetical protein